MKKFTLIELLVVIAVIGVLLTLLLPEGELKSRKGSNGDFDYSFLGAFCRMPVARLENSATWLRKEVITPLIMEQDPYNINGESIE